MQHHRSSYRFRGCGVLLGLLFHIAMFTWAYASENALAGGYRFLFTWYMPCVLIGFPWSIAAVFLDAFVAGLGVLGLATAVCINGYLIGWVLDALVNQGQRARHRRIRTSLPTPALTMDQLLASEAMERMDHG